MRFSREVVSWVQNAGSRRRPIPARVQSLALLIVLCLALGLLPAQDAEEQLPDPVPVQRMHLPPERLPLELQQNKDGVLQELPRTEFEARMQQAAKALKQVQPAPRLVKAEYSARLEGTGLVGKGTWTIHNPDSQPGILPLKDLRLALKNARNSDTEAILGMLDGARAGLFVPGRSGEHAFTFDWSLGGSVTGSERYFDFQVPACVASALELSLPEKYLVELSGKGNLLTGPKPGDSGLWLWRIGFSGKSKVGFKIHQVKGAETIEPLKLVQVKSKQTLWPNRLDVQFTCNVEVLNNVIQELVFDWNLPSSPSKVSFSNVELKDWEIVDLPAAAGAGKPDRPQKALVIRFNEPKKLELPSVRVSCQVPLPQTGRWTSPGLLLRDSLSRGEVLSLHIHPDIHLDQWHPGTFRLVKAEKDAAGFDVLTLEQNGAGPLKRPSARVQLQQPHAAMKQMVWWKVGQKDSFVLAELICQVNQGKYHQLEFGLPKNWGKGWQLETVELFPKNLARKFALVQEGKQKQLVVELQRGVGAGEQVKLKVGFRFTHPGQLPPGGLVLDFPQLLPLESVPSQGTLGITIDPLFQALAFQTNTAATVVDQQGPWGNTPLNFFYTWRDRPAGGKLRLLPQRPQFQAACQSEVSLTPKNAELLARLQLEPVAGTPDTVDLFLSAPLSGRLKLKDDGNQQKISLERIPVAETVPFLLAWGTTNPLLATGILGNYPRGEYWRLKLAQPLTRQESFFLEAAFDPTEQGRSAPAGSFSWEVPLVTVVNASGFEGNLALITPGTTISQLESQGLKSIPSSPGKALQAASAGQEGTRHFRYGLSAREGIIPGLWINTQPVAQFYSPQERCEFARLISSTGPGARLTHQFYFRINDWGKTTLPVILPGGSAVLYVKRQGKWVEQFPLQEENGCLRMELPADPKKKTQWYEIGYTTPGESTDWLLWGQVAAPAPKLPVPVTALSRTWRLPPGIVPFDQGNYLPAAAAGGEEKAMWQQFWFAGEKLLSWKSPPEGVPAWEKQQRQELLDIAEQWHKQKNHFPGQLGTALLFAAEHLPRTPLVVDVQAFQAAGLDPDTPLSGTEDTVPFWDQFGLVHFPCKGAALLTTAEQAETWMKQKERDSNLDVTITETVKAAAHYGHAASGRFQGVLNWVSQMADSEEALAEDFFSWSQEPGWTEWQPLAGTSAEEGLYLVSQRNITLLGFILAGISLVAVWRVCRRLPTNWKFRLMVVWMAGAGICLVAIPMAVRPVVVWPLLAGLAALLLVFFLSSSRAVPAQTSSSGQRVAATLVVLLGTALLLGPGAAVGQGKIFKVFIIGPVDAPLENQKVLVPAPLLQQLQDLIQPAPPQVEDAVVVSAEYEGTIQDSWAEFRVDYRIYCFAEQADLTLPLRGVQLLPDKDSTLEGTTVYPVLAGEQVGYTLPLQGYKDRLIKLRLYFKTRVQNKGDVQELNCGIPRLAQNRLKLSLPRDTRSVKAVTALGRQHVVTKEEALYLDADLGRADSGLQPESLLWVRWQPAPPAGQKADIEVNEYHLGDLRPATASLVSVMKYQIKQGSVSRFQLHLPDHLHLRNVEFSQPEEKNAAPLQARLKSWKTTRQPNGKILEVELDTPVSGMVQLTLGFIPTTPGKKDTIPMLLPTPQQVKSLGGLVGYLTDRTTLPDSAINLSIARIDTQDFIQEWLTLHMPNPGDLNHAYRFQRFNAKPQSGLQINLAAPEAKIAQEIWWTMHPEHVKLNAVLTLSDWTDSTYLEWEVPAGLTVAHLASPSLLRWSVSQNGSKKNLQIWLTNPVGNTTVNLTGWLPKGIKQGPFTLPRLGPAFAEHCPTTVHVGAVKGLTLRPLQAKQMVLLSDEPLISYQAQQPDYSATLFVEPAPVKPQVQILTQAERQEDMVKVTAFVHYTVPVGELKNVTLIARGWEKGDIQIEAPRAMKIGKQSTKPGELTWKLQLEPGTTQQYALTLVGTFPLPAEGEMSLPVLEAAGAETGSRWLAVLGPQFMVGKQQGLNSISEPSKHLLLWPAQAEQIQKQGKLWKVEDNNWLLQLLPRSSPGQESIQILFGEQKMSPGNFANWVSEAEYLFVSEEDSRLHFALLPGARLLALRLDGQEIPLGPISPLEISLPVPPAPAVHTLSVRWTVPGNGPETGPNAAAPPPFQLPQFKGISQPPVLCTLQVPPGYRLSTLGHGLETGPGDAPRPVSISAVHLYRAASQLDLTSALVGRYGTDAPTELIAELQKTFYWHCWQAEQSLYQGRFKADERGPEGQLLDDWLGQLRKQNEELAQKYDFKPQRQPAISIPRGPAAAPLFLQGTPVFFHVSEGAPLPQVQLVTAAQQYQRDVSPFVQVLLLVTLIGLVISFLPGGVRLVRFLWPEAVVVLALVGTAFFGLSILGAVLFLFGSCARLFWLIRQVSRLLQRQPAPSSSGSAH